MEAKPFEVIRKGDEKNKIRELKSYFNRRRKLEIRRLRKAIKVMELRGPYYDKMHQINEANSRDKGD